MSSTSQNSTLYSQTNHYAGQVPNYQMNHTHNPLSTQPIASHSQTPTSPTGSLLDILLQIAQPYVSSICNNDNIYYGNDARNGMPMFRSHSFQVPNTVYHTNYGFQPPFFTKPYYVDQTLHRTFSWNNNYRNCYLPPCKRWRCPMSPVQLTKIKRKMMDYFRRNTQCNPLFKKKMNLRDQLYIALREVLPHCGLYVVGSSMNGFGIDTSDMDLCLMISHFEIDQKHEAGEFLSLARDTLGKCEFLKDICIIKAKVPILRFSDRTSGIECDLNVNNVCGILNTHLLHAYSQLDERVRPLVIYVKCWAKAREINDAARGSLSSYSIVLMVLHYLQAGVSPPVLPCLHRMLPQRFNPNIDLRSLSLDLPLPDFRSDNRRPLPILFVGFLYYYGFIFDFENEAISVREGKTLPKAYVARRNPNPMSQWKEICIEEPFNYSNTARSVYEHSAFERIQGVFQSSYNTLIKTGNLDDIFE